MLQRYKIYINSTEVLFIRKGAEMPLGIYHVQSLKQLDLDSLEENISGAIQRKSLAVTYKSSRKLYKKLKKHYKIVRACGGIVFNKKNEILLIYRRGNWDLPKGKMEKEETKKGTAVREVQEECGLKSIKLKGFYGITNHTYAESKRNILKKSYWYFMQSEDKNLTPQAEEDIEIARWVAIKDLPGYFNNAYSNISEILRDLYAKNATLK